MDKHLTYRDAYEQLQLLKDFVEGELLEGSLKQYLNDNKAMYHNDLVLSRTENQLLAAFGMDK
ncbi:hypothetical protein [Virgibacillus sp. CBA3643]|uniref:hypothetical protein n=1 Tax=Virgibacillus sp. CBA3643 TaxID=2942278 RepID=UPI0035A2AA9E